MENFSNDQNISPPGVERRIHPATRIGLVHLTVANLEREIRFYQEVLGLGVLEIAGQTARLGAGEAELLRLTEDPQAKRYRGVTGLYHYAILLPSRRELARVVGRLFRLRYPNSPTDHLMTKTTYLNDPEGNGIELYADTPEDGVFEFVNGRMVARHTDGRPSDGREPLDVSALLRSLEPGDDLSNPLPLGTRVGHVHLHVADLDEAMRFYHGVLGLDDKGIARDFQMGMASAGGYHHHIGFNTWLGTGAPPLPPDALGLRYITILLPTQADLDTVLGWVRAAGYDPQPEAGGWLLRDPSQNGVRLAVA